MSAGTSTGLHGKLPGYADFLTRRLPREFVDPWDSWLQSTIAGARDALGEGWLDAYLTSPVWSFAIQAGVCGPDAWAGVLMPSVDRVGRYFPLTLAVKILSGVPPGLVSTTAADWFGRAEALALSCLEDIDRSIEDFDRLVQELGCPLESVGETVGLSPEPDVGFEYEPRHGIALPIEANGGVPASLATFTHALLLDRLDGPYTLWWTSGSDLVKPVLAATRGLPAPAAATALFDGRFEDTQWLAPGASQQIDDTINLGTPP